MADHSTSRKTTLYLVLMSLAFILVRADPKVDLALYYESLCLGSYQFIEYDLAEIMGDPDIARIINLRLVPWGNAGARINGTTITIFCQHDDRECYFNAIHACAIEVWPDQETHFKFIRCVETAIFMEHDSGSDEDLWKQCSEQQKLDPSVIAKCYSSGLGTLLTLRYRNETYQLNPPHEYVPWVVVNNEHIEHYYKSNLMNYICHYYQGPDPPKACNNITTIHSTGRNSPTCPSVARDRVENYQGH